MMLKNFGFFFNKCPNPAVTRLLLSRLCLSVTWVLECRRARLASNIPALALINEPNSFRKLCNGLLAFIPLERSHLFKAVKFLPHR